jgi:hypothetical protein
MDRSEVVSTNAPPSQPAISSAQRTAEAAANSGSSGKGRSFGI